jgi:hypothetical protein
VVSGKLTSLAFKLVCASIDAFAKHHGLFMFNQLPEMERYFALPAPLLDNAIFSRESFAMND